MAKVIPLVQSNPKRRYWFINYMFVEWRWEATNKTTCSEIFFLDSIVYYNWYFPHTDIRCITRYSNKIITYIVDKEGKIELVIFVKDEHLIRLRINKTQSNEMVLMIKINKENRTILKCLLRGLNSRPLVNILMLRDRRSTTELSMLLLYEPGHW